MRPSNQIIAGVFSITGRSGGRGENALQLLALDAVEHLKQSEGARFQDVGGDRTPVVLAALMLDAQAHLALGVGTAAEGADLEVKKLELGAGGAA